MIELIYFCHNKTVTSEFADEDGNKYAKRREVLTFKAALHLFHILKIG